MAVIATDTDRLSNLVKLYDVPANPFMCHELVVANEASATTYPIGTVLGKITASGKYVISKQAAADGSQNPVAVVIGDSFGNPSTVTIPAATDTNVLVLARGKVIVSLSALKLDSSFSSAAQKAAAYASLKSVGILVETTV